MRLKNSAFLGKYLANVSCSMYSGKVIWLPFSIGVAGNLCFKLVFNLKRVASKTEKGRGTWWTGGVDPGPGPGAGPEVAPGRSRGGATSPLLGGNHFVGVVLSTHGVKEHRGHCTGTASFASSKGSCPAETCLLRVCCWSWGDTTWDWLFCTIVWCQHGCLGCPSRLLSFWGKLHLCCDCTRVWFRHGAGFACGFGSLACWESLWVLYWCVASEQELWFLLSAFPIKPWMLSQWHV